MPTTALTITSSWTQVAVGPSSVLIPAIQRFSFALTAGGAPSVSLAVSPVREAGEELSCELLDGETLWVAADQSFATSVTKDA